MDLLIDKPTTPTPAPKKRWKWYLLAGVLFIFWVIGITHPKDQPKAEQQTPEPPTTSVSADYRIIKTNTANDEYGPATKVYVCVTDLSKLDQINSSLSSQYKYGDRFLQIWYYSDMNMSNRVAVYTYNHSRGYEQLSRD